MKRSVIHPVNRHEVLEAIRAYGAQEAKLPTPRPVEVPQPAPVEYRWRDCAGIILFFVVFAFCVVATIMLAHSSH